MGIMLSFMLYPNTDLNWSLKVQKSSLDWWCHLLIGRCCWIRSTKLSCLLILGLKRCMISVCPRMVATHESFLLVSLFVLLGLSACLG